MVSLITPDDLISNLATAMREQRVARGFTQAGLAERACVSLSVLRKFERTGRISLESFVKLGFVLGVGERVLEAVAKPADKEFTSIDQLLAEDSKPQRKYAYSPRKKKS